MRPRPRPAQGFTDVDRAIEEAKKATEGLSLYSARASSEELDGTTVEELDK